MKDDRGKNSRVWGKYPYLEVWKMKAGIGLCKRPLLGAMAVGMLVPWDECLRPRNQVVTDPIGPDR